MSVDDGEQASPQATQERGLWAALVLGALVYPLVLWGLSGTLAPPPGGGDVARLALWAGALAAVPAAVLRWVEVRRGPGPPRRLLIGAVLAEMPAAFGLVAYVLGAPLGWCLALCALTFILLLAWWPGPS
jgi:hypothetical protein